MLTAVLQQAKASFPCRCEHRELFVSLLALASTWLQHYKESQNVSSDTVILSEVFISPVKRRCEDGITEQHRPVYLDFIVLKYEPQRY